MHVERNVKLRHVCIRLTQSRDTSMSVIVGWLVGQRELHTHISIKSYLLQFVQTNCNLFEQTVICSNKRIIICSNKFFVQTNYNTPKRLRQSILKFSRSTHMQAIMLKFYAFFNDLIIQQKINIFLEVRSLCKQPTCSAGLTLGGGAICQHEMGSQCQPYCNVCIY